MLHLSKFFPSFLIDDNHKSNKGVNIPNDMNNDEKEKKKKDLCEGVREVNERHEPLQL